MRSPQLLAVAVAVASSFVLPGGGSPATAQTAPPPPAASKAAATAARRAAVYQGPHVVKDSKALGRKMLRDSKPTVKPDLLPKP